MQAVISMFKECFEIAEMNKTRKKKKKLKAPALVHAMDPKFDPYSTSRFVIWTRSANTKMLTTRVLVFENRVFLNFTIVHYITHVLHVLNVLNYMY